MNKILSKKIIILLFVLIGILVFLPPQTSYSETEDDLDARVEEIMNQMTTEEKVGQLVMVYWLETTNLPDGLLKLISEYKVGSVLILETNFLNGHEPPAVNRVASISNNLQTYNWEKNKISTSYGEISIPLFLAVDHEGDGARLTRIRDGMTPLPSQLSIGATWSLENAEKIGEVVGSELNAIGINLLLGPVVDVLDKPYNTQGNLDIRVFGGDPHWVGEMGRAYIRGVHRGSNEEIVTVAKHFPGHGDSNRATDEAVAITVKTLEDLLEIDLIPFIRVTEFDEDDLAGRTEAIMSSHIAIKSTGVEPVSLYEGELTKLISDVDELSEWHKNGFVVVDSLGVGALKKKYGQAYDPVNIADMAFRAGNDLLILHNIIDTTGNPNTDQLEAFAQTQKVIEFFVKNYDDPFYKSRIDEAVRKIIRAKLKLYPELNLDTVLADESLINNITGTEINYEKVTEIAHESTALIHPSNPEEIPQPLSKEDDILFLVQNFTVSSCSECGEEWLQNVDEEIVRFLLNRNFSASKIETLDYYREGESGPAGISTFLYGNPNHVGLWGFPNPDAFPISETETTNIRNKLRNADWIIFLFIAGDCGPNANKNTNRCSVGFGESDTLDKFLIYNQYANLDAKIAAVSFGAPPWKLDSTHINQLDLYYGIFSQITPFHEQAVRVLLGENDALGYSPIDVAGADYYLKDRLDPDPTQSIELRVLDKTAEDKWEVGETIEIEITDFVDKLGNPILNETSVEWRGQYSDGTSVEITNSRNWTLDESANVSFFLKNPGQINFSARIGGINSLPLTIEVLEIVSPIETPDESLVSTPIIEIPEVLSTTTPIPTIQVTVAETPSPSPTTQVTPVPMTTWERIVDNLIEDPATFIAGIIALPTAILAIIVIWNHFKKPGEQINTPGIDSEKQNKLLNIIRKSYSDDELKTLCFNIKDVNYDDLPGSGLTNKARELIALMSRNGRLDELETQVKHDRPHLFTEENWLPT